jgi:hypothetical protein
MAALLMASMAYKLPDLPYDYAALEPAITGEILELHHSGHHAAYVKDTLEKLAEARDKNQLGGLVGLGKTLAFIRVRPCTRSSGATCPPTASSARRSTSTSARSRRSRSSSPRRPRPSWARDEACRPGSRSASG